MFRLLAPQPRPPLSVAQRVDIEWLMRRTRTLLGEAIFHRHEVIRSVSDLDLLVSDLDLPVHDRRSNHASSSDNLGRIDGIVQRLAPRFQACGVDVASLSWTLEPDQREPFVYRPEAQQVDQPIRGASVSLAQWTMDHDPQTITAIAGGMSRHVWQHHRQRDLDVQPQTTSLLPVVLGLGVFASDASLLDKQWSTAGWSGWSLNRFGHYNAMEIGYVMALHYHARLNHRERLDPSDHVDPRQHNLRGGKPSHPDWLSSLRLDSRVVWKQAMKYFMRMQRQRRPRLFDAAVVPSLESSDDQLARWIAADDADFAYAALVVAAKARLSTGTIVDAALGASSRRDQDLVYQAVNVLQNASPDRPDVRQQLIKLTRSRSPHVTLAAARSAMACGVPSEQLLAVAKRLLASESFDLLPVLAWIQQGGKSFVDLAPILRQHLDDAQRSGHNQAIAAIDRCLESISS